MPGKGECLNIKGVEEIPANPAELIGFFSTDSVGLIVDQ